MQKTLLAFLLVAFLGIAAYIYLTVDEAVVPETAQEQAAHYTDPSIGLDFEYVPGPGGYVLEERTPAQPDDGLLRVITLMQTEDWERMRDTPPVGSEGPPVIAVTVHSNPERLTAGAWARANPQYSSFNLMMGEAQETTVGREGTIRYMADGLYASDVAVVSSGAFAYVFIGQFLDKDSDLRRDFLAVLASVEFLTETAGSSDAMKIDISAVCEGALAYMSFPDGAAAETFVADCKAGLHPEVIERFKADIGLPDGSQI